MPIATVSNESQRYNLESAPADPNKPGDEPGYIMARPLPYGMKLERRDRAMLMRLEQEVQTGRKGRNKKSIRQDEPETQKIELETQSTWAAVHDFAYCITGHNLMDVNGNLLDFGSPMTLKILDPAIGTEIENILNELNGEDTEDELETFTRQHTSSSPEEPKTQDEKIQPITSM